MDSWKKIYVFRFFELLITRLMFHILGYFFPYKYQEGFASTNWFSHAFIANKKPEFYHIECWENFALKSRNY